MSTVIAAVIGAVTAFSVALISAYRKDPEARIMALNEVLVDTSPSEWQTETLKAAIDRQYERIESPDLSSWLLAWSVLGAVALGFLAVVSQGLAYGGMTTVLPIASFCYLGVCFLLVAANALQEWRRTRRWKQVRKSRARVRVKEAGNS